MARVVCPVAHRTRSSLFDSRTGMLQHRLMTRYTPCDGVATSVVAGLNLFCSNKPL